MTTEHYVSGGEKDLGFTVTALSSILSIRKLMKVIYFSGRLFYSWTQLGNDVFLLLLVEILIRCPNKWAPDIK